MFYKDLLRTLHNSKSLDYQNHEPDIDGNIEINELNYELGSSMGLTNSVSFVADRFQ